MYTASRSRRPLPGAGEKSWGRRRARRPLQGDAHMRRIVQFAALLPFVTLLSCASTSELVRRSEEGLDSGDMERAYKWSSRALDHEPGNPRAQQVMTTAATAILEQRKADVIRLAEADTLAAARALLELDDFHADVAHYRVTLPVDPEFHQQQAEIRSAAAHIYYDKGAHSLEADRPRRAVAELTEAKRFTPNDADVMALYDRASQEAITPIAILPFNDDVSSPALAQQVSDEVFAQLQYQLGAKRFHFTRLIGRDEVNRRLTVEQAGDLSREEAVSLGRALGARRVVYGRLHDLRSDTHTDVYRETIFKKVTVQGEDGKPRVRFDEQGFEAISRRREITIRVDFEVIETGGGARLAHDSQQRSLVAHTVFTRFAPVGSCDDYRLVPPGDDDRKRRIEKEWRDDFGSWNLPAFLERARREPGRTRYESRHRSEFAAAGTSTPIWLDDLPPVEEMAHIALDDAWMPMLAMLRDLDGKDDPELVTGR
jgi:tetratricopeptide (TPR) repeat protein